LAYGTPVDWAREASNIVWSQGEYDPWRGGGVVEDLNDSLRAVVIPEAAHHLDLFFSHQDDTDAVIEARKFEMGEVRKWVNEKRNTVTAKRHSIRAETQ
jgi:lysosomal Pro-X carboxypeptidase